MGKQLRTLFLAGNELVNSMTKNTDSGVARIFFLKGRIWRFSFWRGSHSWKFCIAKKIWPVFFPFDHFWCLLIDFFCKFSFNDRKVQGPQKQVGGSRSHFSPFTGSQTFCSRDNPLFVGGGQFFRNFVLKWGVFPSKSCPKTSKFI